MRFLFDKTNGSILFVFFPAVWRHNPSLFTSFHIKPRDPRIYDEFLAMEMIKQDKRVLVIH